jgi:preprotein translocase subunit YajC
MAVMWSVIFYTVLAVVAFYFILLQPVLKNQKEQRKAVQTLQIGDEVVTTGGLIGEVMDVVTPADGPTEIILEIAPNVRVRAVTEAISRRLTTLEAVSGEEPAKPIESTSGEVSHTSA